MRVLTVVGNLDVRGTQRAALSYTLAYQRAGHEVGVLAHSGGGPREQLLQRHSIPAFIGGVEPLLDSALREAEAFRAEVVHIHRAGPFNQKELRILRALRRNNIVIETNVFGRVDYSPDAHLVDAHLHISAFCLWRWHRWLGRRPQVGVLVPYPVESDNFKRVSDEERSRQRAAWGIPDDAYVCGHVGFKLSKCVIDGFVALTRKTSKAWLVCVPFTERLAEYVRLLPESVRARIVNVGQISDDAELQRAYSAFDCLLHAAEIGESFGYVLAEAQLCGVPVVTLSRPHRDNAQVELVRHRVGGLVAGQSACFGDAVVELYEDTALRTQIRSTAPARMHQLYDVERVTALALRVIDTLKAHPDARARATALELDPHLRTRVADEVILGSLRDTVGGPSLSDLAMMRMLTHERSQQMVRMIRHREFPRLRISS
ncbi:MAG TPA: glycosyltransferase family 4 protein [Polyangiaceae bacterium]|nr:glycosyltransferase family 4 protein [Polyangiaceae bacterium]